MLAFTEETLFIHGLIRLIVRTHYHNTRQISPLSWPHQSCLKYKNVVENAGVSHSVKWCGIFKCRTGFYLQGNGNDSNCPDLLVVVHVYHRNRSLVNGQSLLIRRSRRD